MEKRNKKENPRAKLPTHEELILAEQEIINELRQLMQDSSISLKDRLRAAAVLALHMNTLDRMITCEGEREQIDQQTLGDYVVSVQPRIVHLRRGP